MSVVSHKKREQGQTIVLVAISLFALLSMAALAIDVTTLYIASTEAQQAADAAALAGAKVFVTSGFTSRPSQSTATTWVCNGTNGLADYAAQAAATANTVSGIAPSITTSCDLINSDNPTITVQVQRTGLPIFFAKIWGASGPTVTAKAKAEAYNPSVQSSPPIQVGIVKPFLLPNCPPNSNTNPNTPCTPYFVDPTTGSNSPGEAYVGTTLTMILPQQSTAPNGLPIGSSSTQFYFYPIDFPTYPPTPACPVSPVSTCNNNTGNFPYFFDNIFCSNPNTLKCGDLVGGSTSNPVDTRLSDTNWNALQSRLDKATQCLIHSGSANNFSGTCSKGVLPQDCFIPQGPGAPTLISPGSNNPDANLRSSAYISRSDSIVSVPLFDGRNLCPGVTSQNPACTNTAPIVGFLQLGIVQDQSSGTFQALVLNVSGCLGTGTPVSGGNISSIPVRLTQPQ